MFKANDNKKIFSQNNQHSGGKKNIFNLAKSLQEILSAELTEKQCRLDFQAEIISSSDES